MDLLRFVFGRFVLAVALASGLFCEARDAAAAEPLSADELAKVRAAEAARVAAIDEVYGSVVAIFGNDRGGGGSGVLYDEAGYALTNFHVVAGAGTEGWGGLADGKLYRWKLIGMDPGGDVAIIQLTGKDRFAVAPLGDSDTVRVGDFAMAMGNPFVLAEDLRPTVTLGIVSGVKRYQPGEGGATMLVYGNCIQVDSSINPGNSGGPLFNMNSQVIGINGRGSFKERGRVNVGVGYAISVEQIKNFIPELLATKTALHGTLDATFGNRGGKVICEQINLDAKIAELGLELGDRLVSFDGEPIEDANEYTNLVTTIPAGWPVEVVFERDGVRKEVWLRLPDLPYPKSNRPQGGMPDGKPEEKKPEDKKPDEKKPDADPPADAPSEKPKDGEKPNDADDDPFGKPPQPAEDGPKAPEPGGEEDKPGDEKPADPRRPTPRRPMPPMPQRPQLPQTEPGKISNMEVNQAQFRRIVEMWTDFAGGRGAIDAAGVVEIAYTLERGGKKAGIGKTILAADGRFRVAFELDGKHYLAGYDGNAYWSQGETGPVAARDLLSEPLCASAMTLARLLKADGCTSQVEHYELQGSDRAAGERSYRLRMSLAKDDDVFVWLSLYDAAGVPQVRLLKTGIGAAGREIDPAVTYGDYREVAGLRLPHLWTVVEGLAERPALVAVVQDARAAPDASPAMLARPEGATP